MANKKNTKLAKPEPKPETARSRLGRALRERFALRMHTSILLLWTFCAGLLTTKALFALGMQAMWLRYLIAIVVAYGAFLLGVRIWLAYISIGQQKQAAQRAQADKKKSDGSIDLPDLSSSGGGSGGSGGAGSIFRGGGGGSSGGGASGSFAADAGAAPRLNLAAIDGASVGNAVSDASAATPSGDGGGILSGIGDSISEGVGDLGGGDEGCLIALAVMVVIGFIALAIGAAVFIISAGPEILVEAAFNAMLAGGLIKASHRMNQPDWLGSVIMATLKSFLIVLVMALAFAGIAATLLPQANTFGQVMSVLWPLLLSLF